METACPWEAFRRANDAGCELDLCSWIVHPAEAWSNLAFIAVAAGLVIRYRRTDRHLPVSWLPAIIVAIGVGSFAFHSSMAQWLELADLAAILLLTGFLLAAYLQHAGLVDPDGFILCFLALVAGGTALAFLDPRLGWIAIAVQGVAFLWLALRIPARGPLRELIAAIALNQAAAVTLWLDKGHVACVEGVLAHVVQPHSFWHILSAASLIFLYRYERHIEHSVTPTRRAAV
jgi:hypothetical protein